MADMSLPNCFKLSAITCSSSVCVEPMHSKLNSFKLFASVLWHRDRSEQQEGEGEEGGKLIIDFRLSVYLFLHSYQFERITQISVCYLFAFPRFAIH